MDLTYPITEGRVKKATSTFGIKYLQDIATKQVTLEINNEIIKLKNYKEAWVFLQGYLKGKKDAKGNPESSNNEISSREG